MAFPSNPANNDLYVSNGVEHIYTLASKSWKRTTPAVTVVVDDLLSTSATSALSANQGRVLKAIVDGLSDPKYVADATARNALTGLVVGDYVVVGNDDGAANWAEYQITAVTDGAWATSTKILLSTKSSYEKANSVVLPTEGATLPATGTLGQEFFNTSEERWYKWTSVSGGAWLEITG